MVSAFHDQMKFLFETHLKSCRENILRLMQNNGSSVLVLDAGSAFIYFTDDQPAPFRSNPYFKYLCPLEGEKHILCVSEKNGLELFVFEPESFWTDLNYEVSQSYWATAFDKISYLRSEAERDQLLKEKQAWILISSSSKFSDKFSQFNPDFCLKAFDWWRSQKSEYEIFCLDQANSRGAEAHKRVKELFLSENPSELELHYEYLKVLKETEDKLPYSGIIAHDEKAAILHYQYKRKEKGGKILLIDSGASFASYGSDITRTYAQKQNETVVFSELILAMDILQKEVCKEVKVGANSIDLQILMHIKLAKLLLDHNILTSLSPEAVFAKELTKTFCPHGLGHLLGLQTHDVGGFQINEQGQQCEKDSRMPHARMNRTLRKNEVITIEPGLYFIPFLLEQKKNSKDNSYFNWNLIETLVPLGGIRIEDNLVIKEDISLNLTRNYLP